ncbi:NUDIX hydrolase [Oceanospirillum sp.]|uniref:NUDIX hydrolase n=1 Tax=Oceanospirillum sp. TaxID=2021254 RepID=UPI003A926F34
MLSRDDVWKPNCTVATVVVKKDTESGEDRYLLVEEWSQGRRVLNQPAGHVEKDESLVNAAIRETLEETRWEVRITDYMGLYINKASERLTYHRHCFIAEPVQHHPDAVLDEGIEQARWLRWEELLQQQEKMRSQAVMICFEDYRKGKRYPLELITDLDHPL